MDTTKLVDTLCSAIPLSKLPLFSIHAIHGVPDPGSLVSSLKYLNSSTSTHWLSRLRIPGWKLPLGHLQLKRENTTNPEKSLIFTSELQNSHLWITHGPQKKPKMNIANGKNNHEWRSISNSNMVIFQQAMLAFWGLILQTSSLLPFPPCQRTKDHAGYLTEVEGFLGENLLVKRGKFHLTTFTNLKKIQPC